MSSETTTLVILIAILIAVGAVGSALASFVAKRLAEREAEIAEAEGNEHAAAFHRAYPRSAKPPATCKAGLHVEPHPTPWVVMPTSDAPQTHGIGDITGKDCGAGTTLTLTTLCTPADVASTPGASGD